MPSKTASQHRGMRAADARDSVATVASGDNVRPRKEPPTQAEVAENATDTEKSGNVATNDPKNNTRLARNRADPRTPNLPGAQSAAK